jgi:hypothetical protein
MMDLRDGLEQIAGRPVPPNSAELMADLGRGRKALRKRRTLQAAGGSLFAVAAAVAAISLSGTVNPPGSGGSDAPAATAQAGRVNLVAYKGAKPKGFTIDKVPDGWFVQGINEYELVIAPDKAKNPGPDVNPSKSPVYDPRDYTDKIAVFLESKDNPHPTEGKKVKVGDLDGFMRKSERGMDTMPNGKMTPEPVRPDGDYGASVFVKQPSGAYLTVQFWEGLGFSEQQMIELAAGVHADKNAKGGVG